MSNIFPSIKASGVLAIAILAQSLVGLSSGLAAPIASSETVQTTSSSLASTSNIEPYQFSPQCPSGNCGPDSSGGTGTR